MVKYNVINPVQPETRFGDIRSGGLFQRFNGADVWIKLSPVWCQRIDDIDTRSKVDESETVRRVVLERVDS